MTVKVDLFLAEFPGQYVTNPDAAHWLCDQYYKAKHDTRFGRVEKRRFYGTPITMLRNACLRTAAEQGFDYVLMVDADMRPDHDEKNVKSSKPFFESTFDFIFSKHLHIPTIVFAPYCGPSPHQNVYVFRWRTKCTNSPNSDWQLEGYMREEAAILGGIQRAAAGPTGVVLIDTRLTRHVPPPWFYYGYTDKYESQKNMTEDVAFTRDAAMTPMPEIAMPHGVPIYCNWDAWACHWKLECVGKPSEITTEFVSEKYQQALRRGHTADAKLLMLGDDPTDPPLVYLDKPAGFRSPQEAIEAIAERGPSIEEDITDHSLQSGDQFHYDKLMGTVSGAQRQVQSKDILPPGHWDCLKEVEGDGRNGQSLPLAPV